MAARSTRFARAATGLSWLAFAVGAVGEQVYLRAAVRSDELTLYFQGGRLLVLCCLLGLPLALIGCGVALRRRLPLLLWIALAAVASHGAVLWFRAPLMADLYF